MYEGKGRLRIRPTAMFQADKDCFMDRIDCWCDDFPSTSTPLNTGTPLSYQLLGQEAQTLRKCDEFFGEWVFAHLRVSRFHIKLTSVLFPQGFALEPYPRWALHQIWESWPEDEAAKQKPYVRHDSDFQHPRNRVGKSGGYQWGGWGLNIRKRLLWWLRHIS